MVECRWRVGLHDASQALVVLIVKSNLEGADCICESLMMAAAKHEHALIYSFESLVRLQRTAA